jgi:hypothetical protein
MTELLFLLLTTSEKTKIKEVLLEIKKKNITLVDLLEARYNSELIGKRQRLEALITLFIGEVGVERAEDIIFEDNTFKEFYEKYFLELHIPNN